MTCTLKYDDLVPLVFIISYTGKTNNILDRTNDTYEYELPPVLLY